MVVVTISLVTVATLNVVVTIHIVDTIDNATKTILLLAKHFAEAAKSFSPCVSLKLQPSSY